MTTSNMLRKRTQAFFQIVLLMCSCLLLTACVQQQSRLPVEPKVAEPAPAQQQATVETYALEQDSSIVGSANPVVVQASDPWQLVEQAANKPVAERDSDLLHAVALFLDQGHYSTAFSMLEQVNTRKPGTQALSEAQKTHSALLSARYYLLSGQPDKASTLVRNIKANGVMNQENYARWLQLDIAIASEQGASARALRSRLQLDDILGQNAKNPLIQLNNQRKILDTLAANPQLFPPQALVSEDKNLPAWIELANLKQSQQLDTITFAAWRQRYPVHPAREELLDAALAQGPISSSKIALLLPMTSTLGRAALAFKTGFDAAIEADGRFDNSRVYDIGVETALVPFYYRNAVNDGADVIIGPLGRSGIKSMLDFLQSAEAVHTPTVVLGELPEQFNTASNVWGLSLSAEQDAVAVAERAIAQGFRQAVVMQKNNAWGARLNTAFTHAFEAKGGEIVANQRYFPNEIDHTVQVKNLLNIQASEGRHSRLENTLGLKLKFSARRRDDIDFVFLAGSAKDARHILPLLKFYRAHNTPVYATASAHTSAFNRFTDADLEGLRFAELPWLLNRSVLAQGDDQPTAQNTLPYKDATLNRLYALGYAAFEVLPQLGQLQASDLSGIHTQTMSLRMDENRNLLHTIAWGRYTGTGILMTP